MEIAITYKITNEKMENFLDSAGRGSSYWAESALEYSVPVAELVRGGTMKIKDHETYPHESHVLTVEKLEKGLRTMAQKDPVSFSDFLSDNYDNTTGDVFLQYCLFGDVIYS